jgi:autotransporter-associated beta strand protein
VTTFHPDLHKSARFIPRFTWSPPLVRAINFLARIRGVPKPPQPDGVAVEDVLLPGAPGAPALRVRLYRPKHDPGPRPALLWIHGGGFLFGAPEFDEIGNIEAALELGIVIAAVDYRLGPGHPFPAPLEDCHSALTWLHESAATLGIDPQRIAIGGASAGGGLAAGLALKARDAGTIAVVFQLLLYPMLDDRTVLRTDLADDHLRLWDTASNRYGWTSYLAATPGSAGVSPYAAPARATELAGLPPAWLGVGTYDLFLEEDLAYAQRLNQAGVPCEVRVVDEGKRPLPADTVGSLTFSNTNGTQYILGNDGNASHGLTLDNNGTGAIVTVSANTSQSIFSNLILADNATFNVSGTSSLLISVGSIGESGSSHGLTKIGTGTLTIDTPNGYTGGTTVNAGVLATTSTGTLGNGALIVSPAEVTTRTSSPAMEIRSPALTIVCFALA